MDKTWKAEKSSHRWKRRHISGFVLYMLLPYIIIAFIYIEYFFPVSGLIHNSFRKIPRVAVAWFVGFKYQATRLQKYPAPSKLQMLNTSLTGFPTLFLR